MHTKSNTPMNTEQSNGYFTIEQMDRANLKTMGNPLIAPWTGSHLLSLLIVLADKGVWRDLDTVERKEAVIDWYCRTPVDGVVEALEQYSDTEEFKTVMQIQKMAHERPVELKRALDAIAKGWRPE